MDAAYTQRPWRRATPRHATPSHAMPCGIRIIKRNYCRAAVNNALLLKRVPATARADTWCRIDIVSPGNRARRDSRETRSRLRAPRFIFRA